MKPFTAWVRDTRYATGDRVFHDGAIWICTSERGHTRYSTPGISSHWRQWRATTTHPTVTLTEGRRR